MKSVSKKKISIAYSPDTDDAFMVMALREKLIDWESYDFTFHVGDIQELNQEALNETFDITAISIGAYPSIKDGYFLMPVGASIGDEFGPALVTTPQSHLTLDDLKGRRIGVPGINTSAHIAAQILFGPFEPVPIYFLKITEAVKSGEIDAGILIHELQLDPSTSGLEKLTDLGKLWHQTFQLPLPLGANAIRRDLDSADIANLSRIYRSSIEYGLNHRHETIQKAVQLAAASDDLDMQKGDRYISMYVNHRSLEFQDDVLSGIKTLFERGASKGLFSAIDLHGNLSP